MRDPRKSLVRRRQFAALAVLAGLVLPAGMVVGTPAAHADAGHCTPAVGLGDFHFTENRWLRTFTITSGTPDVFVPTHTLDGFNPAENPTPTTFTVTTARTLSVSSTVQFSSTVQQM